MSKPQLDKSVSFHCFNKDLSEVAVAKNNDEVTIFKTNSNQDPTKWTEQQVLAEHGGYISGIDWCPTTNQIVTCGHDRNAYVWEFEGGAWKPALVILRINRAATAVKWSPKGDKFAIASGAKCIPVCHYEAEPNWWISKIIKKHKSTVLALDWSPNQKYLVTGGCDFKCRVVSAVIESIDDMGSDEYGFSAHNKFGEVLAEFDSAKAWVQAVSWSPKGQIAFAGHGSTLTFVDLLNSNQEQTINQKTLPYVHVSFLDADTVVAIGFDNNPVVYKKTGSEWKETKKVDPETDGAASGGASTARSAAFSKFQAADRTGVAMGTGAAEKPIKTHHKNFISGFQKLGANKFSTSGVDGKVIQWTI